MNEALHSEHQGVPVIENDDICRSQVDSQASRTSREQETKLAGSLRIKLLHLGIALFAIRVSIDPTILVANETEVILENSIGMSNVS